MIERGGGPLGLWGRLTKRKSTCWGQNRSVSPPQPSHTYNQNHFWNFNKKITFCLGWKKEEVKLKVKRSYILSGLTASSEVLKRRSSKGKTTLWETWSEGIFLLLLLFICSLFISGENLFKSRCQAIMINQNGAPINLRLIQIWLIQMYHQEKGSVLKQSSWVPWFIVILS